MTNKELEKHIQNRIKEETDTLKELFGIDVSQLSIPEISNIITRCNWLISLRYSIEKSEREGSKKGDK